jgi:aspartate/tyrosine/aromatic aminotransferase
MFETRQPPELDKILRLMGMFAADPRPDKVDLGVGVYRSPEGVTPVMTAVKTAERMIWESQTSKSYVGISGDPAFLDAMRGLVLGDAVPAARVAACATVGGTGAVRQVLEMARWLTPDATVWVSDPTWPNHTAITGHLSQKTETYRYYDRETGGIDRDGMLADLARAKAGDLIVLHACCHNPTGADLLRDDWREIAEICARTGAIPFVDMAYLGFAESLEEDAAGTRYLAAALPEVFIAVSCSKNFGLYRERAGAVLIVTGRGRAPGCRVRDAVELQPAELHLSAGPWRARGGDDPQRHGIAGRQWRDELRAMRLTMLGNRAALAEALRAETGSDRFGFFAGQRGMFSLSGATPGAGDRFARGARHLPGGRRADERGGADAGGPFRRWRRRWRRCLRRPCDGRMGRACPIGPSLRPPCQNGKST